MVAALQDVQRELQRSMAPVVMVLAAPEVEAAAAKNGLSLAELLRPFGSAALRQLNGTVGVPVRTPAEHPLRLHSWRLRFHAADTMAQPSPAAADEYLAGVLAGAAAGAATADVPDVSELVASAGARAGATPWYAAYRREYLRCLQWGEHETLDHPVACVLALPADYGGDLAAGFAALWRHDALPPLMQAGVMEAAGVLRHYLLVHDASCQGPEVAAAAAQRVAAAGAALGAACTLVTINSGGGGGAPCGPRFWADALRSCLPGGGAGEAAARLPAPAAGLGALLSEGDLQGLSRCVHELAVRGVIPAMEARLRALNAQVTAARKGLKNQLKSLLWRKPGASAGAQDGGGSTPGTPSAGAGGGGGAAPPCSYAPGSVEAAMRQLGDLALQLGDWDTAASTLRLLAADTKADRAYKAYAGVQEALGTAAVLAGAPPSEAAACYREALHRYSQLSQAAPRSREGVRYATRAALVLAGYLAAAGLAGEASWALMKAHFQEEDVRAGLLLEQAAYCLLARAPPQARKFGFHLVLAGLRYDMCGHRALAQRAYRQVLGVYRGRRWALIEEHLQDALGRQAREAGDAAGAAAHFMAMLACPHAGPACQRAYLAQFQEALRAAQEQLGFPPALELPLPEVDVEHVGVQADGQACYAGVEARQVAPEAWRVLDAALHPAMEPHPSGTWLDGGSRAARLNEAGEAGGGRSCCAGEAVGLDVALRNPLGLDLAVTRLRLACTWEPAAGVTPSLEGSVERVQGEAAQQQGFQVHEESVTLQGGERVVVHLRAVPLRPGTLQVQGVAWVLNGAAHGHAAFRIPRPRPLKPGSSSKVLLDGDRPSPGGVEFRVLPPMPRLEISVAGLPPTLLAGEVVRCTMLLRNCGAMTLQRLSMAAPAGAGVLLQSCGPAAGGSGSEDGCGCEVLPSFRGGAQVFTLPAARLGVGQELTLPVWFRAPQAGPAHLALAWRYEPLVRLDTLSHRTLRFAQSVEALPCLHLAARLAAGLPSSAPGGCLLQAQVHSLAGDTLTVTRLACPSSQWQLAQPDGGDVSLQVAPDSSAVLHCQLVPASGDQGDAGPGMGGLLEPEASLLEASRRAAAAAARSAAQRHLQQPPAEQQRRQQHRREEGGGGGLDVVVLWRAGGRDAPPRHGFACLHGQRLHSAPPVDARLHGPASAVHDFGATPLCVVTLTLQLRNTMAAAAAVCVEAGKLPDAQAPLLAVPTWAPALSAPANSSTAGSGQPQPLVPAITHDSSSLAAAGALPPARHHLWCGRTRVTLSAVPPGQLVEVPLQVAVSRPGKVALADCLVSWHFAGPPHIAGSRAVPVHNVDVQQL